MPHQENNNLAKLLTRKNVLQLASTVNESLQQTSILHAIFLERVKTNEVNKVVSFLNDEVFPEVAKRLETRLSNIKSRGYDSDVWKTKRHKDMLVSINELIRNGMRHAGEELRKSLSDIGIYEAKYQKEIIEHFLNESASSVSLVMPDIVTPPPTKLRSIISSKPFEGRLLKNWWAGLKKSAQQAIESQINIGVATGEPTHSIVQRIVGTSKNQYTDGAFNTTRRHTETIVRTSINHIATQAREMTYGENKSVVKGVKWVSTLDSRTSDICIALDGEVFGIYEGPRPPAHHQCRSTTIPVVKSWKELGIKGFKEMPPGMRSSLNGQVPAKMTYGSWLKTQPQKIQEEVLGIEKATLFRRGVVPIKKFVDNKFKTLTLPQLRALEKKLLKER